MSILLGGLLVACSAPASKAQHSESADPIRSLAQQRADSDQIASAIQWLDLLDSVPVHKNIRSPEEFFGFPLGSRHLRHHQLLDYADYLASVSPRMQFIPYAASHGGRTLGTLVVASDVNAIAWDDLFDRRQTLASGNASINADDRSVIYFGYSVHGDEASGANAFPAIAYYLAAGKDDRISRLLQSSILLLDPSLNPDGGDRFANWANENRGLFASPDGDDREHNQPWPGGRTNYYWFDLNRDWMPVVHPESQGRLKLFHKWRPNIVLDFHEMGSTSSYFFQPGIPERNNPRTPESTYLLTQRIAAFHASAMDDAEEAFFTEERYDDFYVGKGSTYPDLHGSIGILFEQGSTRGLINHNDQFRRTFADTVENQIRTSISSMDAAIELHTELLQHQIDFYRDALQLAESSETTAYLLHASGDRSRLHACQQLLRTHSILSHFNHEAVQIDGRVYAANSLLVVPTRQPEFRFIDALFARDQLFVENIFYDVSAWTVPLAFDLTTIEYQSDLPDALLSKESPDQAESSAAEVSKADTDIDASVATDAIAGFAMDPNHLNSPRLVARLLREGTQVRVANSGFQVRVAEDANREFEPGTWLVLRATNRDRWPAIVETLTTADRPDLPAIHKIPSSMTPAGSDLGSTDHSVVPNPKVVLAVGSGTRAYSAGSVWHFLDQRMQLPLLLVDVDRLANIELQDKTCIVLPDGSYSNFDEDTIAALRQFVSRGGTIVALQSAIARLQSFDLLQRPDSRSAPEATSEQATTSMPFGEARSAAALESIAGAIFKTEIDSTHPLAYGFPDTVVPTFRTSTSVFEKSSNPYATAATYKSVEAGYVSESNRERLRDTAAVWAENVGRGRVICIADNPVFRGYFRGSERFLTNAILIGPTLRIPNAP